MRLSEQALSKLSQLAMAVELHEHKRFSLRKDIDHVIGLLKVASNSGNIVIQSKLGELSSSLTEDSRGFFRTLGIELNTTVKAPTAKAQKTYRGQVVVDEAPTTAVVTETKPEAPKKKIIYRGKVIYRWFQRLAKHNFTRIVLKDHDIVFATIPNQWCCTLVSNPRYL